MTQTNNAHCPVATTVQLIGNKWKLLIIRTLLTGPQRFGALKRALPGISQKVLTENLRAMERDGLIIRTCYDESPPRVDYRMSELGLSMQPIIDAMAHWGVNYEARKEVAGGEAQGVR